METVSPGAANQRSPHDMAEEFDALWSESRKRAESRHGLTLDELKLLSSRMRRMARLRIVPERESGIRQNEHFSWPGSSRKAG